MMRNPFFGRSDLPSSPAAVAWNSISAELSTMETQPILGPATSKKQKKNHSTTPFDWLTRLPGFAAMPRQRPSRLAKVTFPHRLDRDEAMGICFTHFDELLSAYESSEPGRLMPIIATAISPAGSGKSFFLDEVGAARPADVDKFCKPKWAPALKSAITISISFSGFSNVKNADDRDDRALCARMLYSYFDSILPDGTGFPAFFKLFTTEDMAEVSPAACIEFIAGHFVSAPAAASATDLADASSGTHGSIAEAIPSPSSSEPMLVLLMVDELAKSNCEDAILAAVGSILDESPQLADGRKCLVLPVFTSLHETKLTELLTGSQREIMKVPLHSALKSAPAAMKSLLAIPRELHPLIDVLCNDVGCHGRMLEAIAEELLPTTMTRVSVDVFNDQPFRMLPVIHTHLLYGHSCSTAMFRDLTEAPRVLIDAVCHVLLGHTVPRNAKILPVVQDPQFENSVDAASVIGQLPMSEWTYDYLLSRGVFIADSGNSTSHITPVMSPLQLEKWALSNLISEEKNLNLSSQMKLFLQAILRAFSARTHQNQVTFEDFHQDIELIRRFALRQLGVRELTPMEYFNLDESDYGGALPKNPAACLQTKMDLGADSELSRAEVKMSDVSKAIGTQFQSGAQSTIELAVEGQKLFDIRITQPALNEKRMLCIFEQLRLSDAYYHRKAKEDDEIRKPQWMKKIQSQSQSSPIWRDAVFVYITARRIRDWDHNTGIHPDNVILLGPDKLARFYGPSIMGAHVMTTTTGSHCD